MRPFRAGIAREAVEPYRGLIEEQVNVKALEYPESPETFAARAVQLDAKKLGPLLKGAFGPVLAAFRVDDFDEAMKVANNVRFGLTCSIYTGDPNVAMRFIDRIEAGMVHINSPTVGGEAQLPFGGMKSTGYGNREMSEEGLEFFTELKTVFYDYTGVKRQTNIY